MRLNLVELKEVVVVAILVRRQHELRVELFVERNGISQSINTVFQVSLAIGMKHCKVNLRQQEVSFGFGPAVDVSSLVAIVNLYLEMLSVLDVAIGALDHPDIL